MLFYRHTIIYQSVSAPVEPAEVAAVAEDVLVSAPIWVQQAPFAYYNDAQLALLDEPSEEYLFVDNPIFVLRPGYLYQGSTTDAPLIAGAPTPPGRWPDLGSRGVAGAVIMRPRRAWDRL